MNASISKNCTRPFFERDVLQRFPLHALSYQLGTIVKNTLTYRIALAWARTTKSDSLAARIAKQVATVKEGALVAHIDPVNVALGHVAALPQNEARAAISALHDCFNSSGSLPAIELHALREKLPDDAAYDELTNNIGAALGDATKPDA